MCQQDETEHLQWRTCYDRRELCDSVKRADRKKYCDSGVTAAEDYEDGILASGETLIKAGERV